jgi:UDP-glucuronate decarboxylase
MRVLLTGATGFIGSHVARLLLREGCEVSVLLRGGCDRTRIAAIDSRLTALEGDLLSSNLSSHIQRTRPEVCIHCAWFAKPGQYLRSRENIPFIDATLRLALLLAESGCRRFVGLGTCFEYDTSAGYLSETSRVAPSHLYSACKVSTWLTLEQAAASTSMQVAWARLFYLYGPFEDASRLVPSVVRAILESREAKVTAGEQVRDFLHVEDAASAVCAIARSRVSGPFNVGSGVPVTVRDLVSQMGAITGRSDLIALGALPYSESDPMFVCANNRKLTTECGWSPRYTLKSGLEHAVGWWRENLDGKIPGEP